MTWTSHKSTSRSGDPSLHPRICSYCFSIQLFAPFCIHCSRRFGNILNPEQKIHYIPWFLLFLLIPFFLSSLLSLARFLDLLLRRLCAGDTLYFCFVFLILLDIISVDELTLSFHCIARLFEITMLLFPFCLWHDDDSCKHLWRHPRLI